ALGGVPGGGELRRHLASSGEHGPCDDAGLDVVGHAYPAATDLRRGGGGEAPGQLAEEVVRHPDGAPAAGRELDQRPLRGGEVGVDRGEEGVPVRVAEGGG